MNFTSQLTYVGNARDPDVVYYNATLINNNTAAGNQDDPVVVFKETKDSAILSDTSQYEMSVRKVTMSGPQKTLPILIPQVEVVEVTDASGVKYTTIPDVNKTVYQVTFGLLITGAAAPTNRAYVFSQNVTWFTENNSSAPYPRPQTTAPVPVGNTRNVPQAQQDISTDYYYCYSYNHWLICLNNALSAAWTSAQAAMLADAGVASITRCPRFEFDEVTGLFSLYTDTATSVTAGTNGSLTELSFVGMNTNLEGLMTNFDTQFLGSSSLLSSTISPAVPSPSISGGFTPRGGSQTAFPENVICVRNKSGTNIQLSIDPTTGVGYTSAPASLSTSYLSYVTTQDFPSTGSLWSPISEIVLTTASIPVRNEFVCAPIRFGVGNLGTLPAQQTAFQAVLVDFEIKDSQDTDSFRGYLKYEPNLHKIVKLAPSKDELKTIDIFAYWRFRLTNQLIPLRIYNLGSITIQLMFRRVGQDA